MVDQTARPHTHIATAISTLGTLYFTVSGSEIVQCGRDEFGMFSQKVIRLLATHDMN